MNAGHIFPDGLLNNVLKDYNPYATPDDSGDVEKAKAEMAQSKYDTNQDGVCDAPECSAILAITSTTQPAPKQAAAHQGDPGGDRARDRHQGALDHHDVREVQQPA